MAIMSKVKAHSVGEYDESFKSSESNSGKETLICFDKK